MTISKYLPSTYVTRKPATYTTDIKTKTKTVETVTTTHVTTYFKRIPNTYTSVEHHPSTVISEKLEIYVETKHISKTTKSLCTVTTSTCSNKEHYTTSTAYGYGY